MNTPVLDSFAQRIHSRGRYGFNWMVIVTIIMEALQQCFEDRNRLQSAARDGLSRTQMAALRVRCRREVRGEVPLFQAISVGNRLADDIATEFYGLEKDKGVGNEIAGDVYQAALDEVDSLLN